ncbi:hypothetical protein [Prauserella muralis]|uniref:Uncharacterized protein n=1 Tax=Prauserella muralis TaxID=588067 RepID=A0A2V4AFE1_9PSEU|nr:hypothetical protein [Prauserella muralis]PXY17392.1 hypothetical protein BAY60_34445 [Prauserella muralis]TWE23559.1 hypothetical protein FHX69_4835 [Prauserella muralis]
MSTAGPLLVLAVLLVLLGRWGLRNADTAVPAALGARERARRARVLRRGAVAAQVVAAAFVVVSVLALWGP